MSSQYGWRFEAASAPHRLVPSVRTRSALAAVLVVALALTASGVLLLLVLQRSLLADLDSAAAVRAEEVAARLLIGGEGGLDADLKSTGRDGQLVQIVSPAGQVVASSSADPDQGPVTGLRPGADRVLREEVGVWKILDRQRPFLVLVRGVHYSDGRTWMVLVASSTETQRESMTTVLQSLLVGFPVLLLVVGLAIWVLIGRALRPVERIRQRVAGIGANQLDERVPVPPTRDEIAWLAITMNRMLDRLQASQQAQRQFVSDASHELRSPLASLTAALEVAGPTLRGRAGASDAGPVAAEPPGESDLEQLYALMSAETARMRGLVDNLLLLARVDDHGLQIESVDVDLDDLLEQEARRLRTATALQVSIVTRPVRVQGDLQKLSQAVRNLVDNAVRHAQSGVRLGLSLEHLPRPGVAVLTVDDDGPGVPEVDRARVFDRFVRLDESRDRASGGSGLGLSIVREVVTGHHGTVELTEAPGGGCRAVLRLPTREAE